MGDLRDNVCIAGTMDKLIDDEMLVAQFQSGRQNAFDELMKRYKAKIFSYLSAFSQGIMRMLRISPLKCFLRRTAPLRIGNRKPNFQHGSIRLRPISLLTITVRKRGILFMLWRTWKSLKRTLVATDLYSDPVQQVEEKERGRIIREAIDQLSPKQKAVFMLSRYEGLQLREVAETLEMAEGTVKIHLHRAVKRLQTLLRPLWENNEI